MGIVILYIYFSFNDLNYLGSNCPGFLARISTFGLRGKQILLINILYQISNLGFFIHGIGVLFTWIVNQLKLLLYILFDLLRRFVLCQAWFLIGFFLKTRNYLSAIAIYCQLICCLSLIIQSIIFLNLAVD